MFESGPEGATDSEGACDEVGDEVGGSQFPRQMHIPIVGVAHLDIAYSKHCPPLQSRLFLNVPFDGSHVLSSAQVILKDGKVPSSQ